MAKTQQALPFPSSFHPSPARLPQAHPPVLLVVVDTEEEFDWSKPFSRESTSTQALADLHLLQDLLDEFGVKPTYAADYPVVVRGQEDHPLLEFCSKRGAEIGLHMHPWVTPPFREHICARNSFAGNLPAELEREKIQTLVAAIESRFGISPKIYKAGRYGIGPNTPKILEEEGFLIDLSPCPAFDFSNEGGPDFSNVPPDPIWFGATRDLLSIPTTGAVVSPFGRLGEKLFWSQTSHSLGNRIVSGVLSRSRTVERLHLSPEGFTFSDHMRLTKFLFRRGCRVFTLSLHSPSLSPGFTPYVRTEEQRQTLLRSCRQYLNYFLSELGGMAMTPTAVRELAQQYSPRRAQA